MTTQDFEKLAKAAVIKQAQDAYGEDYTIDDISVVWMVHVLGHKKCILIDNGSNDRIYEVTYNSNYDDLYLDIYSKKKNCRFDSFQIDDLLGRSKPSVNEAYREIGF